MTDIKMTCHDLNRDMQNIYQLLKFIKNDVEIKDEEISSLLNYSLSLEEKMIERLSSISKSVNQ